MDVILLERIAKLGQMGETVKVRDGYARNFLLPQGKALRANAANKTRFEAERVDAGSAQPRAQVGSRSRSPKSSTARPSSSSARPAKPASSTVRSPRATSPCLPSNGFNIGRNQVDMNHPVKTIGLHTVPLVAPRRGRRRRSPSTSPARRTKPSASSGRRPDSADAIYGIDESEEEEAAETFFEEGVEPTPTNAKRPPESPTVA